MKPVRLDCRHLLCPLPVIRVQDAIAAWPSGTLVEVLYTDPGALRDIPAWCRLHGHEVVEIIAGDRPRIRLRVAPRGPSS